VTIIVPARNEEDNIGNILNDLEQQDYPSILYEVVVVNDQSTDLTAEKVLTFLIAHPLMNLRLIENVGTSEDLAFKKRSIKLGVTASTGNLIIMTDADTRLKPGWISTVVNFYEQERPEMIIGPVAFHQTNGFFEHLQVVEFFGMMAATAGSCNIGFPLMCNGANLAFTRKSYIETMESIVDLEFPSGDDVFLMLKIKRKYGVSAIKYLFCEEAIVSTKAKRTLRDFFSQRLRWVSKSRGYSDPIILGVAMVTWLFNFLLLSALIGGILNTRFLLLSIIFLCIKMIIELPSLIRIMSLTKEKKRWYLYPITQVFNLFYVSLVGFFGNILSYEWKGRKISPVKRNS